MPVQPITQEALMRSLATNPTLDEFLYQIARVFLAEALPDSEPVWIDVAARYRVFGAAAGLSENMVSSCKAVLRTADAALAERMLSHPAATAAT